MSLQNPYGAKLSQAEKILLEWLRAQNWTAQDTASDEKAYTLNVDSIPGTLSYAGFLNNMKHAGVMSNRAFVQHLPIEGTVLRASVAYITQEDATNLGISTKQLSR